ncbi:hypothetical protein T06_7870, partial [Trichinella sp. T6]
MNGLYHQHRALSYSCVSLGWLNGVTQYWSRNLSIYREFSRLALVFGYITSLVMRVAISAFGEYFRRIRNHVDKYVITKHYYQLMPLSLATVQDFSFRL